MSTEASHTHSHFHIYESLPGLNDPAFKRRGDYDLVEVAKLILGNQVPSNSVRVRFETPC